MAGERAGASRTLICLCAALLTLPAFGSLSHDAAAGGTGPAFHNTGLSGGGFISVVSEVAGGHTDRGWGHAGLLQVGGRRSNVEPAGCGDPGIGLSRRGRALGGRDLVRGGRRRRGRRYRDISRRRRHVEGVRARECPGATELRRHEPPREDRAPARDRSPARRRRVLSVCGVVRSRSPALEVGQPKSRRGLGVRGAVHVVPQRADAGRQG